MQEVDEFTGSFKAWAASTEQKTRSQSTPARFAQRS